MRSRLALVRHSFRGKFATNVLVMLIGTTAGQAASVLLSPLLTRLFVPEAFGYLSVYAVVLAFLGVIASLGFEIAIPICTDDKDCANLTALSGLCVATTTCAVALLCWLLPEDRLRATSLAPLLGFWYLVPLGMFWLGGYNVLLASATRVGSFRPIAATKISQGISGPLSQIVLGLLGAGAPGLIFGSIVGQASGTSLLARAALGRVRRVSWRGMIAVGRRYIRFPLLTSWSRLLEIAGGTGVLYVLFSVCFSPAIAGFIFLSERVIMRPLMLVCTSLLQVFIGEAGRAISEDPRRLRRRTYQVLPWLFVLAAGWIIVANVVAGWAFPVLFGPRWADAVPYFRALSLAGLTQAILHPISPTLNMLERQWTAALWQIGRLVLVLASVLLPWRAGTPAVGTLWIWSAAEAAASLILLGLILVAIEGLARTPVRRAPDAAADGPRDSRRATP